MGTHQKRRFGSTVAVLAATLASGVGLTTRADATVDRSAATVSADKGSFRAMSDSKLWSAIAASGRKAVVGLKAPDGESGLRNGRVVLDDTTRAAGTEAVRSLPGVTIVATDSVRPTVTVVLSDERAMRSVRDLAFVEYLEPSSFKPQVLDMGCTGNSWNSDAEGGDVYTGSSDVDSAGRSDRMPRPYGHSRIPQAWQRGATGQGITVGVVDTGVFPHQTQLYSSTINGSTGAFTNGMSGGRFARHLNTSGSDYAFDDCNHGTRTASVVAAPRDGVNMVGVAWKSNLVTVRGDEDVVVAAWESGDVARAIRAAADNGARIMTMAFGTGSWAFDNIKHEIEHQHHVNGVLFVGAAGTKYCDEGVVFPAKMPEVIAVTGVTADGRLHPTACGGPEVDIAAVIDEFFAAGKRPSDLITFGGSSAATSMVSGIAALVWSEHPDWTRDQVRNRLLMTASQCCSSAIGWGVANAYKAVGGFASLGISGPRSVEPSTSYTLSAHTSHGDGPFTYRWSTGETSRTITKTAGTNGTSQSYSVTVTDTREGKALSASVTVAAESTEPPPPIDDCSPKYCP